MWGSNNMSNLNNIIQAVKNANVCLKVSELSGAVVKLNSDGQPYRVRGGFAIVFRLTKNSKQWALRVWHTGFNRQKERFQHISKYLEMKKLPYFADFIFEEKGLVVDGKHVDIIRMEWLEGDLLKKYIEKNKTNQNKLLNLTNCFFTMFESLHEHAISHGDLQHGNILIDQQGNIRLLDYDSICIPEIEGKEEFVTGLRGYQHHSRMRNVTKTSLKADYFSELIIYLSLYAISLAPYLWDKYKVKDTEVLLFNDDDFINLEQSVIYKELTKINSKKINILLNILSIFLKKQSYLELSPFMNHQNFTSIKHDVESVSPCDNKFNGYGELYFNEGQWKGDRYKGEFLEGFFHGQGEYHHANGSWYQGEFQNGKYIGEKNEIHFIRYRFICILQKLKNSLTRFGMVHDE